MIPKPIHILLVVLLCVLGFQTHTLGDTSDLPVSQSCTITNCDNSCPSEALLRGKTLQQQENIKHLFRQAVGVRERLKTLRANFLKTANPEDLFPIFYYHTTANSLGLINEGNLHYPEVALQEIIAFYDAYEFNRVTPNKEPHWKAYYEKANSIKGGLWSFNVGNPIDLFTPSGLMRLGADAHINGDLPRALQHTLKNTTYPINQLKDDFIAFDSLFSKTSASGFQDVQTSVSTSNGGLFPTWWPTGTSLIPFRDTIGSSIAESDRHAAWEKAVSNQLPVTSPQPRGNPAALEKEGITQCPDLYAPVLVIDRSGSLNDKPGAMQQIQNQAAKVVDAIRRSVGLAAVINFSGASNSAATEFTSDPGILLGAINGGGVSNTGTAIYDAVVSAVNVAVTSNRQAMLIVFTDGMNNQGRGIGTAIEYCKKNRVSVIMIGFMGNEGRNEDAMRQLAGNTGGFYENSESVSIERILERFNSYAAMKLDTKPTGIAE